MLGEEKNDNYQLDNTDFMYNQISTTTRREDSQDLRLKTMRDSHF